MDLREDTRPNPLHQPQVACRARAELPWQRLPLAAGAHAVEDAGHRHTIGNPWPATLRLGTFRRQQRLDVPPQLVGYVEEVLVHGPAETISASSLKGVLGRALSLSNGQSGIVLFSGGTNGAIARDGDAQTVDCPGGHNCIWTSSGAGAFGAIRPRSINDVDDLVFQGGTTDTTVGVTTEMIVRRQGTTLTKIAEEGDSFPGTMDTITTFGTSLHIDGAGGILWGANSTGGVAALFISVVGNPIPIEIVRTGTTSIEGLTLTGIDGLTTAAEDGYWMSSNGEYVAFIGTLINNSRGAFLVNRSSFQPFCFGDGFGAACPCGNSGHFGRGCENSSSTKGALLRATGSASLANDSLALTQSCERPTSLSLFLQGNSAIAATIYGDGLRCIGGTLKRLYDVSAFEGTVQAPGSGDPSVSSRSSALGDPISAGSSRYYQVYYRDPAPSFCPPETFTIGNAVSVLWSM